MQKRFGITLSVVGGAAAVAGLLLMFGGASGQSRAAPPSIPRQAAIHAPQTRQQNGASSRPLVVLLNSDPLSLDYHRILRRGSPRLQAWGGSAATLL